MITRGATYSLDNGQGGGQSIVQALFTHNACPPNFYYVRPSFTVSRLSRRNSSWSSHYSKSLSGYWMVFQLAGLQWLTVLSMLIRGITITLTGDWHSRGNALSHSIMLRNSLLTEGKIRHIFCLGNVMSHQNYVSALKHNWNVMHCLVKPGAVPAYDHTKSMDNMYVPLYLTICLAICLNRDSRGSRRGRNTSPPPPPHDRLCFLFFFILCVAEYFKIRLRYHERAFKTIQLSRR